MGNPHRYDWWNHAGEATSLGNQIQTSAVARIPTKPAHTCSVTPGENRRLCCTAMLLVCVSSLFLLFPKYCLWQLLRQRKTFRFHSNTFVLCTLILAHFGNWTPWWPAFVRCFRMMHLLYDVAVVFIPVGTAVAQWLRCCATNRKDAGSIPAGVSGFFIDI